MASEKAFDKNSTSITLKPINKAVQREHTPQHNSKPMANNILSGETQKAFPPRSGRRMCTFTLLFSIVLEVLTTEIRQEMKGNPGGKEETKLS